MTIQAGTLVPREARDFGSYELIAKLATGGMAEIFLARRIEPGVPRPAIAADGDFVVVKRILPHLAEDDHFVTMFRDEANLASKLEHENVCKVHALGHVDETWFIVMEYLHGIALSRMLTKLAKARQFVDTRIVAGMIVQACEGLHHAHELRGPDGQQLGVVHRDVSPPNIFVTFGGEVKLLDFGIAKARGASSKTRTGTVKGKNAYMSPEQILGKPLDRRSDVFALGAVMYELLAVKRLFHRESDFLTFKAITEEPIPDIRDRRPDLPAALRGVLTRALARDPNGRYPSAKEFGDAVRAAVVILGGPASREELAKLVSTDFADEIDARQQLFAMADRAAAVTADTSKMSTVPAPASSTNRGMAKTMLPLRAATEDISSIEGEVDLGDDINTRSMRSPDRTPASMIVQQTPTSGLRDRMPPPPPPPPLPRATPAPDALAAVIGELPGGRSRSSSAGPAQPSGLTSAPVAPSVVVGSGDAYPAARSPRPATAVDLDPSHLLRDGRRRQLRNLAIGLVVVGAVVGAVILTTSITGEPAAGTGDREPVAAADVDAGRRAAPIPVALDGGMSREDIVAISKFGFLSIDATAKTTIFIDGQRIGEAPLTRLPLPPGIHKVKAIGPRNKTRRFEIIIKGGEDTDQPTIEW